MKILEDLKRTGGRTIDDSTASKASEAAANYSNDKCVLSPCFDEAALFLEALSGKDASFTFQTFDDVKVWSEEKQKFINRKDTPGAPDVVRIFNGTFDQHKAKLAELNAKGAGVFVTVNQTDLKGRTLANIVRVRALFVDLDGSPIQPIKDLPQDLQPHIIIESSPNRWHAYWMVNNCELDKFKQLQQELNAKFDGDKNVNDLPRVMRLAGFIHNKGEPFITRIVELQESNLAPFSVNKLIVGLGLKETKNSKPKNNNNYVGDDFVTGQSTSELMAELESALDYLSCEDYHDWIRQAMRLKSLGHNARYLFMSWSSKSAKFDSDEASAKWESLSADRTGYKAIFAEAQQSGWINPRGRKSQSKTHNSTAQDPYTSPESSGEWQEPEAIIAHQENDDYPLDQLPEPLRLLVIELVNYLQCPVAMAVSAVFAALSLCIQGLVNVARDNELIGVVSLFLMVIAESGERKSACDSLVTNHIKELDKKRLLADMEVLKFHITDMDIWSAERDGLIQSIKQLVKNGESIQNQKEELKQLDQEKPIRPRGTTMMYEDTTVEGLNKALFNGCPSAGIFSSEAGIVFGGHGMSQDAAMRNMATHNKYWDGGDVIATRSDISKNMLITGRRLTLSLATQESTVRAFFDGSKGLARGTGFGARFLIAWPKSTQGTRLYKAPPSHWPHKDAFIKRTSELLNTILTIDDETGALQPVTLKLSSKAKDAWIRFYNDTEIELRSGGELTDIKDVTSKAADNVARLAALFHVYEYGITGTISEAHIISAGYVMAWHLMESRRFFGEISLPKELRNTVLLDNWLIQHCKDNALTQISTRTVKQFCPNALRDKEAFDNSVKHLIDLHRVKIVNEGKKKLLQINPILLGV